MVKEHERKLRRLLGTKRKLIPTPLVKEIFEKTDITPEEVATWLENYYCHDEIIEVSICLDTLLKGRYYIESVEVPGDSYWLEIEKDLDKVKLSIIVPNSRYMTPTRIALRLENFPIEKRKKIIDLLHLWMKAIYEDLTR